MRMRVLMAADGRTDHIQMSSGSGQRFILQCSQSSQNWSGPFRIIQFSGSQSSVHE